MRKYGDDTGRITSGWLIQRKGTYSIGCSPSRKKQTLSKLIKNLGKDTKKLFDLVNNLTSNKSSNKMPEGQSDSMLAKEFATFFLEKIENLCNLFTGIDEFKPAINEQASPLENFSPLTCNEVQKEVMDMDNKTCELDHIPTQVLNESYK